MAKDFYRERLHEELSAEIRDSSTDESPENLCIGQEDTRTIVGAIMALPCDLKEVIVSYYVHGQRIADITRRYGIPHGTVKSRLHRARAILGDSLVALS
ncbi:MAG: RNA polymerase sigma factor [Bacillota bacterium]